MPINIDDIDKYKKHWEIDKQWEMRKNFMMAHYENFEEDRLLCLAQCYVNIELLKNEYDDALMNEVKTLADKIKK